MSNFSSLQRASILSQLEADTLDVLIIGGGITGAGIALDAVTRGLKTGLVEMQDFAAGTSSRSTKLVHGGLRYLKQLKMKMVADVGKERAIVYENGPHITTPEWMMLPFYQKGTFGPFTTNIGLFIYDFLAGVHKKERHIMLNLEETIQKEPLLNKDGLKGSGYYVEYKTDDARLTIDVLKKAVEHGAEAVNHTEVIDFIYNTSSQVNGIIVKDHVSGVHHTIYAKKFINATGPWVDQIRDKDDSKLGKTLHLTKGVHLVFSKEVFPLQQAIYFDAPDGRMIFAIPRDNKTYVGTTDTNYDGNIAHPTLTIMDRDYLLEAIDYMFPTLQLSVKKIESSWAGLRPLIAEEGKNPDNISRKDELFVSKTGLISIAGGKLTGYRKMAEEVVDMVVKQFKVESRILYSRSDTSKIPISGGDVGGSKGFKTFKNLKLKEGIELGLNREIASLLIHRYGSNIDIFYHIYKENNVEAKDKQIDPVLLAELIYAMEYELAFKPTDFLIRRTGALFFNIDWVKRHKKSVLNYMDKTLQWTTEQRETYHTELQQVLHESVTFD